MYWPNGVPRVYAVNGPDIAEIPSDVNREHVSNAPPEEHSPVDGNPDSTEKRITEEQAQEQGAEAPVAKDTRKWENEAINGLCVSRSGHIFATITESSLSLWQTRVRTFTIPSLPSLYLMS